MHTQLFYWRGEGCRTAPSIRRLGLGLDTPLLWRAGLGCILQLVGDVAKAEGRCGCGTLASLASIGGGRLASVCVHSTTKR